MRKAFSFLVSVFLAASAAFAAERVMIRKVANHYPWDGKVDCTYTLSGLDAGYSYKGAFTLSVEKDNTTVERTITNEFASVDGTYTTTFDCQALFGGGMYPNGGIMVELVKALNMADATGTKIGIKGDVLVVDVSGGTTGRTYLTAEFTNVDIGSFNCDAYKTSKIVFRKLPAGTFIMGSDQANESHRVFLSKPFYIGVFEMTQRQWELVMGSNPCSSTSYGKGDAYPLHYVSYNMIRGSSEGAKWPSSPSVDADSFIGKLRARTGISTFDLPTEAQWEYACRAGTRTTYSYGNSVDDSYMWYLGNASTTKIVGTKPANPWGLYDMHGNVWEWCLDWYDNPPSYGTDPKGASPGWSQPVVRSGGWTANAACSASAYRTCFSPSYNTDSGIGFRLSRSLP